MRIQQGTARGSLHLSVFPVNSLSKSLREVGVAADVINNKLKQQGNFLIEK